MLAFLNVIAALCLVLAAVFAASGLARRYFRKSDLGVPQEAQVEVLSRASLAPKQGVAVVRFGNRTIAVSYGEGGVRALADLESQVSDIGRAPKAEPSESVERTASVLPFKSSNGDKSPTLISEEQGPLLVTFQGRLKAALRKNLPLGGLLLGLAVGAAPATAQAGPADVASVPIAVAAQAVTNGAGVAQQVAPGTPVEDLEPSILRDLMGAAGISSDSDDEESLLPGPVGAVVFIAFLTILPTLLLLMTSFTRILVVLNLMRQALGTQTAPPSHLLIALSLMLTGFVMSPTLEQVNVVALQPWVAGEIDEVQMLEAASLPFRAFMISQVRDDDLILFVDIQGGDYGSVEEVPLTVLASAFVTSELRKAFQIGFALFLPFVIVDVVVASVLMSMGMFMLPPAMVSMPFKLLLFVLVDGWALLMSGLVRSFFE